MNNSSEDDEAEWYAPDDATPKFQCPCCDYVTLPERGTYLICPICFWEDDGQDFDELEVMSGPNHGLTLLQARLNFKALGACTPKMVQNVLSVEERSAYQLKPREH